MAPKSVSKSSINPTGRAPFRATSEMSRNRLFWTHFRGQFGPHFRSLFEVILDLILDTLFEVILDLILTHFSRSFSTSFCHVCQALP